MKRITFLFIIFLEDSFKFQNYNPQHYKNLKRSNKKAYENTHTRNCLSLNDNYLTDTLNLNSKEHKYTQSLFHNDNNILLQKLIEEKNYCEKKNDVNYQSNNTYLIKNNLPCKNLNKDKNFMDLNNGNFQKVFLF